MNDFELTVHNFNSDEIINGCAIFSRLNVLLDNFNKHNRLFILPYDIYKYDLHKDISTVDFRNLTDITCYYLLNYATKNHKLYMFHSLLSINSKFFVYLKILSDEEGNIKYNESLIYISKNVNVLFALFYPKLTYVQEKAIKEDILKSFNNHCIDIVTPSTFENVLDKFLSGTNQSKYLVNHSLFSRDVIKKELNEIINAKCKNSFYYFVSYIETSLYFNKSLMNK